MGPAWARVGELLGQAFLPWHHHAADVIGELDPVTGLPVYAGAVITAPRQAAKTTLFGSAAEHRLMTTWRGACWYTEKTQQDALAWLRDKHIPLIEQNPVLEAQTRRRTGNTNPGVAWPRLGSRFGVFAPNVNGITGKQSDLTGIDECQHVDEERGRAMDVAAVPAMATRDGSQLWRMGTAGTAESTWWLKFVLKGRASVQAGLRTGVAYIEYGCPKDIDPLDPSHWADWHPAYGYTISADGMARMLELLGPEDFARQVGNQWPDELVSALDVIPASRWRAVQQKADMPADGSRIAFGYAAASGRENGAICAAWYDTVPDDRPGAAENATVEVIRVDLVHYDDGIAWLVGGPRSVPALLAEFPGAVVGCTNEAPDLVVTDPLVRGGTDVAAMSSVTHFAAATGYMIGLVETGRHNIRVCPSPRLDQSVEKARLRPVGQGTAWMRRGEITSAPVVAATAAVWTLEHREPEAEIIPFEIL